MPIVTTREEAATILEVTVKSIGNWKKEDGFPKRDDDQYDTDEIAAWRAARNQQRSSGTVQSESVGLKTKAVKLQILETKRQSDEMKLEKQRGNLFERSLVLELLGLMSSGVREVVTRLQQAGLTDAAQMILDQMDRTKKQIDDRVEAATRDSA